MGGCKRGLSTPLSCHNPALHPGNQYTALACSTMTQKVGMRSTLPTSRPSPRSTARAPPPPPPAHPTPRGCCCWSCGCCCCHGLDERAPPPAVAGGGGSSRCRSICCSCCCRAAPRPGLPPPPPLGHSAAESPLPKLTRSLALPASPSPAHPLPPTHALSQPPGLPGPPPPFPLPPAPPRAGAWAAAAAAAAAASCAGSRVHTRLATPAAAAAAASTRNAARQPSSPNTVRAPVVASVCERAGGVWVVCVGGWCGWVGDAPQRVQRQHTAPPERQPLLPPPPHAHAHTPARLPMLVAHSAPSMPPSAPVR